MVISSYTQQRVLFALMCLIWGTNFLALKAGTMAVPPAFFSGTRWTAAGLILLAFSWYRGQRLWIGRRIALRVVVVAFLMVAFNATVLLYGLRYVSSGLAAVISSALTPVSLLVFSVLLGQESFSRRQIGATALGIFGIGILFGPRAFAGQMTTLELLGVAGVLASTLAYSGGSVLARPLMRSLAPVQLAAFSNFLGGLMLLTFSFLFEPDVWTAASGNWGWPAWVGWFFLLIPGSLGGTVIYLLLVRDWGASRTGTYSFICPVIAVALGMFILGERLTLTDAAGIVLMLIAAALALRRR